MGQPVPALEGEREETGIQDKFFFFLLFHLVNAPTAGTWGVAAGPKQSDIKGATHTLTTIREDERRDPACPRLLGSLNEKWQRCSLRAVKKPTAQGTEDL